MLDLDSPRWRSLEHAYGYAHDVPEMLRALERGDEKGLDDLYSSCLHQGSIGSASFAVVPHVERLAESIPKGRDHLWCFIGGVAAGSRTEQPPEDLKAEFEASVARVSSAIRASLEATDLAESAFIFLLGALVSCRGEPEGSELEGLADGEMTGRCPACRCELTVAFSGDTAELATEDGRTTRLLSAGNDGYWVAALARNARQIRVATLIEKVRSSSPCPACGLPFQVLQEFSR